MAKVTNLLTLDTYGYSVEPKKAVALAYMQHECNRYDYWNYLEDTMKKVKETEHCFYIGDYSVIK